MGKEKRQDGNCKERRRNLSRGKKKTFAVDESPVGSEKKSGGQSSAKERRNHPCWTKEAFPTHESSVGGKKKSRRAKVTRELA